MAQNLMKYLPKLSMDEKTRLLAIINHNDFVINSENIAQLMLFPRRRAIHRLHGYIRRAKGHTSYWRSFPYSEDKVYQLIWGLDGKISPYHKGQVTKYENYYKIIPISKR